MYTTSAEHKRFGSLNTVGKEMGIRVATQPAHNNPPPSNFVPALHPVASELNRFRLTVGFRVDLTYVHTFPFGITFPFDPFPTLLGNGSNTVTHRCIYKARQKRVIRTVLGWAEPRDGLCARECSRHQTPHCHAHALHAEESFHEPSVIASPRTLPLRAGQLLSLASGARSVSLSHE